MKIRITKEFDFEASHALSAYDGLCANIHGHSYKLFVTIKGTPSQDKTNTKYGMVMDFSDLKVIIQKQILDIFDHALILRTDSSFAQILDNAHTKIVSVPYQPTCENMLVDFVNRISASLPAEVSLAKIRLHETATSFAEWFERDNEMI